MISSGVCGSPRALRSSVAAAQIASACSTQSANAVGAAEVDVVLGSVPSVVSEASVSSVSFVAVSPPPSPHPAATRTTSTANRLNSRFHMGFRSLTRPARIRRDRVHGNASVATPASRAPR
jgi:hypothetical protein